MRHKTNRSIHPPVPNRDRDAALTNFIVSAVCRPRQCRSETRLQPGCRDTSRHRQRFPDRRQTGIRLSVLPEISRIASGALRDGYVPAQERGSFRRMLQEVAGRLTLVTLPGAFETIQGCHAEPSSRPQYSGTTCCHFLRPRRVQNSARTLRRQEYRLDC